MTDAEQAALANALAAVQALGEAMERMSQAFDQATSANIALQAQLDTANATIASLKAAADPWASVDKTGATDVTDKVQALWDKGLSMPAGKYLVDAVKGLKARNAVKLDPQAILVVKPNGAAHYLVVEVMEGCSLEGGQIIGDRDQHDYSSGGTHEWGHGLKLRTGAKASNIKLDNCTGDGWQVVGDNVEARNIVATNNRRQGCSVFGCTGFRAYDCVSDNTNGTPPSAGFDFEPDKGGPNIVDARLERCVAKNGPRAGFLAWMRSEVAGSVDVTLVDCVSENDANGVQASALAGKVSVKVQGGTHTNRAGNIRAEQGSTITVDGCAFGFLMKDADGNWAPKPRTPFTLAGTDTRTKYDIQTPTSTTTGLKGKAVVGTNSYV